MTVFKIILDASYFVFVRNKVSRFLLVPFMLVVSRYPFRFLEYFYKEKSFLSFYKCVSLLLSFHTYTYFVYVLPPFSNSHVEKKTHL